MINPWETRPGKIVERDQPYPFLEAGLEATTVIEKYFRAANPAFVNRKPPLFLYDNYRGLSGDEDINPDEYRVDYDPYTSTLMADSRLEVQCGKSQARNAININIATGVVKALSSRRENDRTIIGFPTLPSEQFFSPIRSGVYHNMSLLPRVNNNWDVVDQRDIVLTDNVARLIAWHLTADGDEAESNLRFPFCYQNPSNGSQVLVKNNPAGLLMLTKALLRSDKSALGNVMHDSFRELFSRRNFQKYEYEDPSIQLR